MPITDKQAEMRRTHLGSSDTPVILGVSPYNRTPADVYWSKVRPPQDDPADYQQTGNVLENAMLDWCAGQLGVAIIRNQFRVARDGAGAGVFAASCDALIKDRAEAIEAKYANAQMGQEYGDEGTDQVPDYVVVQVQHQMYVADLKRIWVPAAIAGFSLDLKLYCVPRDDELINMIVERGRKWWDEHVCTKTPPDGDSAPPMEVLKRLRRIAGTVIDLGDEAAEIVKCFEQAKADAKEADDCKKRLQAKVIEILDENEAGLLPDGRMITYREQKSAPRIDTTRLRAEHPDIAEEYITQGTHRTLRILKSKKKGV